MTDLGKMHYFLGIEVVQSAAGIFITQKKYTKEVLKKFEMEDCNSVAIPAEPRLRLMMCPEDGSKDELSDVFRLFCQQTRSS
ncbi:unnamed protein product [Rhodiola kirilowii]